MMTNNIIALIAHVMALAAWVYLFINNWRAGLVLCLIMWSNNLRVRGL